MSRSLYFSTWFPSVCLSLVRLNKIRSSKCFSLSMMIITITHTYAHTILKSQEIHLTQFSSGAAHQWPADTDTADLYLHVNIRSLKSLLQFLRQLNSQTLFGTICINLTQYLITLTIKSLTCWRSLLDHLILVVGDVSRQAAGQEYPNELRGNRFNKYIELSKRRHSSNQNTPN